MRVKEYHRLEMRGGENTRMKKRYLAIAAVCALGLFGIKQLARASYEQPQYTVSQKLGEIEIRQYQPFITAEVDVDGEFQGSMSTGFRRLAGYIFGGNEGKQRISMTSPVMMEGENDTEDPRTMSFVVPSQYKIPDLPKPEDEGIRFTENPSKTMAALRFSGVIDSELYQEKKAQLLQTIENSDFETKSVVYFYGYDPPAVPGSLRRNEVVVEVGEKAKP